MTSRQKLILAHLKRYFTYTLVCFILAYMTVAIHATRTLGKLIVNSPAEFILNMTVLWSTFYAARAVLKSDGYWPPPIHILIAMLPTTAIMWYILAKWLHFINY